MGNAKTGARWCNRETAENVRTGPTVLRSAIPIRTEETMVVAFRRHTFLSPKDFLYALSPRSLT